MTKTFLENLLNLHKKFYCIIRDCICFLESLDQDGLVPLLLRMFILNGTVEIENPQNGNIFKVNGQHLKPFLENYIPKVDSTPLEDPVYQD